jgi:hypothetical protein
VIAFRSGFPNLASSPSGQFGKFGNSAYSASLHREKLLPCVCLIEQGFSPAYRLEDIAEVKASIPREGWWNRSSTQKRRKSKNLRRMNDSLR